MKLQPWQFSNLIFEVDQLARELACLCGNEDTPVTTVIDIQERLARVQLSLLKHLYEIELEKTP